MNLSRVIARNMRLCSGCLSSEKEERQIPVKVESEPVVAPTVAAWSRLPDQLPLLREARLAIAGLLVEKEPRPQGGEVKYRKTGRGRDAK
jgi:hypothetical protein